MSEQKKHMEKPAEEKPHKQETLPFKVYFITAPFERSPSGDFDYVQGMVQLLGEKNAIHYHSPPSTNSRLQHSLRTLCTIGTKLDERMQEERDRITNIFIRNILQDAQDAHKTPILNLQIRPPDTGMTISPEALSQFRKAGIKIVITCHEYQLNTCTDHSKTNKISQEYFQQADHVIFFNEADKQSAIQDNQRDQKSSVHAASTHLGTIPLKEKASLSCVAVPLSLASSPSSLPVLLQEDGINACLKKDSNIIFFGSIRARKGFEHAPALAEAIQKNGLKSKIIIAGAIVDINIIAPLIAKTFSENEIRRAFQITAQERKADSKFFPGPKPLHEAIALKLTPLINTHYGIKKLNTIMSELDKTTTKLPIEFHFSPSQEEMIPLFQRAKYAYAYDQYKGFAFNASSMITLLAQGCILYTNAGFATPKEWNSSGSPVLLSSDVISDILSREGKSSKNKETLIQEKEFFTKYFAADSIRNELLELFSSLSQAREADLKTSSIAVAPPPLLTAAATTPLVAPPCPLPTAASATTPPSSPKENVPHNPTKKIYKTPPVSASERRRQRAKAALKNTDNTEGAQAQKV